MYYVYTFVIFDSDINYFFFFYNIYKIYATSSAELTHNGLADFDRYIVVVKMNGFQ